MAFTEISQSEAYRLLKMLKYALVPEVIFPAKGENMEFRVIGDDRQDVFAINIFRGKINQLKYNIGARILKNGLMLLELHINPSNVHLNPDGEKIKGSHWHVYKEGYGRLWAFPAEDLDSGQFVENTILFLKTFHVVKGPVVKYQDCQEG